MAKVKRTKEIYIIADAVEGGLSDLQELADEMRTWADNMEGTGLENTQKYYDVSEVADALEGIADCIDIPEAYAGVEIEVSIAAKRGQPRWLRRDNALACLQAAHDYLSDAADNLRHEAQEAYYEASVSQVEFLGTDEDQADDLRAAIEEYEEQGGMREAEADELDGAISELENTISETEYVEFPGMF